MSTKTGIVANCSTISTRDSRNSSALTISSTGYATPQPNAGQTAQPRGHETAPNAPRHKAQTAATKGTPLAKTLVTYFSATGTTKDRCMSPARVADSDLFAIVPANPYTSADLDWRDKQSRAHSRQPTPPGRPAITSRVEHIEDYDIIFLGFPSGGTWRRRSSTRSSNLTTCRQNDRPICQLGRERNGQDGVGP